MKVKELMKLIDRLDPESTVMRASTFEINNRIKVCAKLIVPKKEETNESKRIEKLIR